MELRAANEAGVPVEHTPLDGDDVRDLIPVASENIRAGVRLHKQRYINPGVFTHALADAVRSRGGRVVEGFHVSSILPSRRGRGQFTLLSSQGEVEHADTVVAAAGAWMQRAARRWGVHVPVAAGRGYSFTAHTDRPVTGPVYLPEARVACTPLKDGLRVAGTMEFTSPDAPLQRARVGAIARSAAPYFEGVDLNNRGDEGVGPRPVSADGLPLVGPTRVPGLHVAGGHGMWGITHGPVTGRLLARAIATGVIPAELRPFTPDRKSTRLNSSHVAISYAVVCLKKKSAEAGMVNEKRASTATRRAGPKCVPQNLYIKPCLMAAVYLGLAHSKNDDQTTG